MSKLRYYFLSVAIATTFVNCVSLPLPAAPVDVQAYKGKPEPERTKKYEENRIDTAGGKINGVPVTAEQIEPLFQASYTSENTRSLKASHNRWQAASTIFSATGGGFLGWMIGLQLNGGVQKSTRESLGPSYFWAIGGGSLAIGIAFAVIAGKKLDAASESYNQDLFRALDLQQKTTYNPIPWHEQYAHHTFSWTYHL